MSGKSASLRIGTILAGSLALASCASTSHVTAFQEAPIAAPRSITLALDDGETLPFGLGAEAVAAATARAGYPLRGDGAGYRLALSAAMGSTEAGSYFPPPDAAGSPDWVARPDRNWRARVAGGRVLRVTAVLIDSSSNREVWRGTGTLRTGDPRAAAPRLVEEVLAKLPRG